MRLNRASLALLALALTVGAVPPLLLAPGAGASPPGDEGRIAFESNRDGSVDIYVAAKDGSDPVNVSNTPSGSAVDPAWSPDGSLIAYSHGFDVYVVAPDGSDPVNLTPAPNDGKGNVGIEPAWAPDGSLISYVDSGDIWTMAPDGSGKQNLTGNGPASIEREHSWAADGESIVMVRDGDLWLLDVASGDTRLLHEPDSGGVKSPDFAPDGERVVFEVLGDLWVMPVAGGEPTRVVTGAVNPQWSPDGARIMFASTRPDIGAQNGLDVFSAKVNGQGIVRVLGAADVNDTDPAREAVTPGADLAVSVTAAPNPGTVGEPVVFTIGVTNSGPATARLVSARTVVPRGSTLVSATGPAGACARRGSYLTCPLGSVPAGGSATATVTVSPTTVYYVVLTAAVFSSAADRVPQNDEASMQVQVQPPASPDPTPFISWLVPHRIRDWDGDNFTDEEMFTSSKVPAYEMTIDGCSSSGRVTSYAFRVVTPTGSVLTQAASPDCTFDIRPTKEGKFSTELTITTPEGSFTATKDIPFRDFFVVSLGDSVASGEGNPDVPCVGGCHVNKPPVKWQNRRCHRSANAGPSIAARMLEWQDATTSVTYVHLACSGAQVTEGIMRPYKGMEDKDAAPIPPQANVLRDLMAAWKRKPDAVMVSIGANDAHFADVVTACLMPNRCNRDQELATKVEKNLAELPNRYKKLNGKLIELGIPRTKVFITEYFDPTRNEKGEYEDCLLTPGEWKWAAEAVVGPLNDHVRAAANKYGWTMVGGIASAYREHGSCSKTSWVRSIEDSFDMQGFYEGAFHPTDAGHFLYGRQLFGKLQAALY